MPVLAATKRIPDSPWFLTAKIDLEEVTAPLRERFYMVAFILVALVTSSGAGIAYLWRSRDVLYYRQQYEAERERLELAQRYEYLVRNANDIILHLDKDLKIIEANERALSSYGYSREEFLRLHLWDLYSQGKNNAGETAGREWEIQNGQAFETIHKRKDGTTFPVAITSSALEIDGSKLYQKIIRDMTKSKEKEEALLQSKERLQFLSSQLLITQENERGRISKELHDDLGQALMVLKFQLELINSKCEDANKALHIDFVSLLQYLDGVIEKVRRLSWDLSPASLEQFGLSTTIQNLLEVFGEHYDIRWSPDDLQGIDNLFSPLAQVNIYRIFQESLTNIGRHAEASRISVSLKKQEDHVSFTVADNGRGFEVNEVCNWQKLGKCIGLESMQERAQLAGGSLEIRSQPGTGTKIIFTMPIDKETAAHGDLSPFTG
ncbi:MAG: PAS domain S-box protein [Syntrophales bacterium]|nr:PAS domain S-box protein [Syntrophales bacterium]MDD5641295.1 PAS domain S-box protein [Syntrophales bacterium]